MYNSISLYDKCFREHNMKQIHLLFLTGAIGSGKSTSVSQSQTYFRSYYGGLPEIPANLEEYLNLNNKTVDTSSFPNPPLYSNKISILVFVPECTDHPTVMDIFESETKTLFDIQSATLSVFLRPPFKSGKQSHYQQAHQTYEYIQIVF